MSFANIRPTDTPQFDSSKIRKTEFMQLKAGAHTIRILEPQAKDARTHYINRVTVECLGDDCPICANNKNLIRQFPENFREQAGYVRASERHYVNVFDKTPAKVCTACSKEYKDITALVCSCGTSLPAEAKPLNKVKVLAKGPMLFGHLETIHNSILDEQRNPIGINNYDINIIVSGSGRDISYTPIPNPNATEPVELPEEGLFDLDKALITLEPEEMLDLLRGVTLKDIFAARRSSKPTQSTDTSPVASDAVINDVQAQISNLFSQ